MKIKDKIHKFQENAFNLFIIISYTLIFITFFGFSQKAPKILGFIDYYVRIYICLFLIWRFHPFKKVEFTNLDRKIAFSAGLFIFTTTALDKYLIKIFENN
jgi:hypothetical protein